MLASPNQPGPQAPPPRGPLIIIGASARAAAQSAIRAGYEPWCIDLFADRDLRAIAPVKKCPRDQWPAGVLELLKDAPPGPVMFTGAMENHLGVMDAILRERALMNGPPSTLDHPSLPVARVREPTAFRRALLDRHRRRDEDVEPDARTLPLWLTALNTLPRVITTMPWYRRCLWRLWPGKQRFLVKPHRSGGGRSIRFWQAGERLERGTYLQAFIQGTPISAVYVMVDGQAILMGATEQLIGDPGFGAADFLYVGNLGPLHLSPSLAGQLQFLGQAIAHREPLAFKVGVFGIDAILSHAGSSKDHAPIPYVVPVEINPRFVASIEVLERFANRSIFTLPLRVESPRLPLSTPGSRCCGKAMVYARRPCRAGDLNRGIVDAVADVPDIGEHFDAGDPVCTVLADAPTREQCMARLREMAAKVYTRLVPA